MKAGDLIPTANGLCRLRRGAAGDEVFLYALFAAEKRAELELAGLAGPALDGLIAMQQRGRAMTYGAEYPAARDWIAEQDGQPLARLLEEEQGDVLHVIDIAVSPGHRRLGLGRGLIMTMQTAAREQGRAVGANILQSNTASRSLFKSLGFYETIDPGAPFLQVLWGPRRHAA